MNLSRRSLLLGCGASWLVGAERESLGPLGLEIYSLRRELAKDVPGTLTLVRQMGFSEVEVPNYYGLTAGKFREQLDKAHLRCTAMVAQHDRLDKDLNGVVEDARVLDAASVIYPWVPHQNEFTEADCRRAATDMNLWGKSLKQAGLEFCYHPHGYEFRPSPEGHALRFLGCPDGSRDRKFPGGRLLDRMARARSGQASSSLPDTVPLNAPERHTERNEAGRLERPRPGRDQRSRRDGNAGFPHYSP